MAERQAPEDRAPGDRAPEHRAPGDIAQLVADHAPVLYRYAYRLSGSTADAEDLTQETFLIAQRKLDQVRDSQNIRAWLFTVLRNCYLKSRRQRLPRPLGGEFDIDTVPEEVSQQGIDSEELQGAITALADEFKVVVLMFYFEHRSYREIAELLDLPLGTVMSRLARAKAHLRRKLSEPAGSVSTAAVCMAAADYTAGADCVAAADDCAKAVAEAAIRIARNKGNGSITAYDKPAAIGP